MTGINIQYRINYLFYCLLENDKIVLANKFQLINYLKVESNIIKFKEVNLN